MCKNYYLQIFLEDRKYVLKEYKMTKFTYQELELDFFDESDFSDEPDKENNAD